eukprot:bmy_17756T0
MLQAADLLADGEALTTERNSGKNSDYRTELKMPQSNKRLDRDAANTNEEAGVAPPLLLHRHS